MKRKLETIDAKKIVDKLEAKGVIVFAFDDKDGFFCSSHGRDAGGSYFAKELMWDIADFLSSPREDTMVFGDKDGTIN